MTTVARPDQFLNSCEQAMQALPGCEALLVELHVANSTAYARVGEYDELDSYLGNLVRVVTDASFADVVTRGSDTLSFLVASKLSTVPRPVQLVRKLLPNSSTRSGIVPAFRFGIASVMIATRIALIEARTMAFDQAGMQGRFGLPPSDNQ